MLFDCTHTVSKFYLTFSQVRDGLLQIALLIYKLFIEKCNYLNATVSLRRNVSIISSASEEKY